MKVFPYGKGGAGLPRLAERIGRFIRETGGMLKMMRCKYKRSGKGNTHEIDCIRNFVKL